MPKVSVVTLDKARSVTPPETYQEEGEAIAFVDGEKQPLHLYLHELGAGQTLRISPGAVDCVAYVWSGEVEAGGHSLPAGSSLIVEHGEAAALAAQGDTRVLTFTAREAPTEPRAGGHVHILPRDRVPRAKELGGANGVGGAMHADSGCPTCEVWLHENHFPGTLPLSPEDAAKGIHSHSEDEIIFVIDGQIRLGEKLFGAGTALAIAADTLYSFTPGPDGLSFINFRAGTPSDIQFASGPSISETEYWRERLPRPEYLEPQ